MLVERRRNIGSRYRPEPRSAFGRLCLKENASNHLVAVKDHIIVLISDQVMLTSWSEFEIRQVTTALDVTPITAGVGLVRLACYS